MSDLNQLRQQIEEQAIDFVDLRAVDLTGRWRHVTLPAKRLTEALLRDGVGFDGSNYGFRGVEGSDMVLVPDLLTAYVEDAGGERLMVLISNVHDAGSQERASLDPRGVAERAAAVLRSRGQGDDLFVSPEFEYYVFESARFHSDPAKSGLEFESVEGCEGRDDLTPFVGAASAYHASVPGDRLFSMRCEVARRAAAAGIDVKYHHHEVGAFGQQEIELGFAPLVRMADVTMIMKLLVRGAADDLGLSATFLPKPMHGHAGSGMHLHQYVMQGGRNRFNGGRGLSEVGLCYIGGVLTHGRSLMALTNASTNSYRRLVPGHEAPVCFVFGSGNRSAAVRIPAYAKGETTRMELRTMDATCNPYLAFAAILLAGLDGIARKLNAQDLGFGPFERDASVPEASAETPPRTLDEALDALEADHDYLVADGVFTPGLLEEWVRVKRQEAACVALRPHPHEVALYYDL
ncbi:MAG: glutamine synthetase beta-grasp domain-containing protein [Candidatus Bipolaricaulota bacterium]